MRGVNQDVEISQSFYSVYSHESMFEQQKTVDGQKLSKSRLISPKRQEKPHIMKSNISLDESGSSGNFKDKESEQEDFKTVIQKRSTENKKVISVIHEESEKNQEQNQISMIMKKQYREDSPSLLKDIDCLSSDQISPEQAKQIKQKIELLKKEQEALQKSLQTATQIVGTTKAKNLQLQKELVKYKQFMQSSQLAITGSRLTTLKEKTIQKDIRAFNQDLPVIDNSAELQRLKSINKLSFVNQQLCIYQNEGYKVQAFYSRQKKNVTALVKLTPHYHIISKKRYKFALQVSKNTQIQNSSKKFSYESICVQEKFSRWPNSKYHFEVTIHEYDEYTERYHVHAVLVPIPIVHFLQERLNNSKQENIKQLRNLMSSYTISFKGIQGKQKVEKLQQMWWMSKVVSCLGWNQLILIECERENGRQEKSKSEKATVEEIRFMIEGKKNGEILKGIIESISFYISN